jgi:molybdenum-dependent DNA-binding transcriptional regulator ModE
MVNISLGLTEKETELLEAIIEEGDLRKACTRLDIKFATGSQRLFRMRERYKKAQDLIRDYERYRAQVMARVKLYL